MTVETISQWSIVLLLLVIVAFSLVFYFTRHRSRTVSPEYAARFYSAYLGEAFRLAGYNAATFLRNQDLHDANRVLEIYCVAEAALLAKIEETLSGPEDRMAPAQPAPLRELSPAEYSMLFRKRAAAADEVERNSEPGKGLKEGAKKYAKLLWRKINPVLQQLAGGWVGGKLGIPGG